MIKSSLKSIILLNHRTIQCMHCQSHENLQPVEDLAISSLLEIDQKEPEKQQSWTDQRKLAQLGTKLKSSQIIRAQQNKTRPTFKQIPKRYDEESSLRSHYNPEMMEPNDEPELNAQKKEEPEDRRKREERQKKAKEGDYWSSKVNWMSISIKQEVRSQPKLSKKFSFGYEANIRQPLRGSTRYDSAQKTRHQEYKTNLIHSILSGEAEALRLKQLQEKSKSGYNRSCESSPGELAGKEQGQHQNRAKGDKYSCNIAKNLQESMRKTLKKISARSFQDGCPQLQTPLNKQSELERAALVRTMLQNIEKAKERAVCEGRPEKKQVKIEKKPPQILDNLMQAFTDQTKQIKKKSNVVNLNVQAQKIYKGSTVNKWNGRRLIQVVKIQ